MNHKDMLALVEKEERRWKRLRAPSMRRRRSAEGNPFWESECDGALQALADLKKKLLRA